MQMYINKKFDVGKFFGHTMTNLQMLLLLCLYFTHVQTLLADPTPLSSSTSLENSNIITSSMLPENTPTPYNNETILYPDTTPTNNDGSGKANTAQDSTLSPLSPSSTQAQDRTENQTVSSDTTSGDRVAGGTSTETALVDSSVSMMSTHVLQVCVVDLLHSAMAMPHLCFLEIPSFAHFAFFLYTWNWVWTLSYEISIQTNTGF